MSTKFITVRFQVPTTMDKEQFIKAVTQSVHPMKDSVMTLTEVFELVDQVIDIQGSDDPVE